MALNLRNPNGYDGSPATQNKQGISRFATAAEAAAGVLDNVAISPLTAQSATALDFASPPVLGFGSTTARPVHATTLGAVGTTTINTSGAAATTIGTGGTGTVGIGNATGNTQVTGSLTASTGLVATAGGIAATGTSTINTTGAAATTIGTGGTGVVNIGNATGNTAVTGTLTATALKAATIDTNVAAAQLSLNATTIAATGSDAAVSLNLTAKGTGALVFSQGKAGVDQNMQITNSDNTAADGRAGLQIAVGGSTNTGDPYIRFEVSGVGASTMSMGLDNSVSDTFVISNSNDLGTNNALTLTQAGALNATTSITAGTSLTATLGAITATNGNLVLGTAGNKQVYTSVASGIAAGANSAGTVTLVAGTITVSTTAVTASSLIRLTRQSVGATGANDLGILSVGAIVAATSFVIDAWTVTNATALQTDDVSVIFWEIVN